MSKPRFKIEQLPAMPDLLALQAASPSRYPHLLQSTAVDGQQGRYDILFAFPAESLVLDRHWQLSGPHSDAGSFLSALDAWQAELAVEGSDATTLPFAGGWFVYLGYELAKEIEPKLQLTPPDDLPIAVAQRIPAAIIIDQVDGATYCLAEEGQEALLDEMRQDVAGAAAFEPCGLDIVGLREEDPARYLAAVKRTIRYIIDGDIFQANLSRLWEAELGKDVRHADIYDRLRKANPGPYNALATFGAQAIMSSSPERLVESRRGTVQTRPIAGTRPRGADADEDAALTRELIGHPKERAEHIMLIDLERNDLGRIAEPGSVEVNELMVLETYAHVHHIVSNVRARLRAGVTPGETIAATFPGGTITGCPKVRCMEIISELEQGARSAYTGSLGYLNRDGSLDLNILIRTMIRDERKIRFRAGGGTVFDSIPENELEETRAKAKGLVRALTGETG
ncbi:MAG: aminodeoxychorismate synthase component I [Gammaproteobacteria bacterium]|nr:aminodeoxychorismate synthase component I [Gammaproteobacteria bacterium]